MSLTRRLFGQAAVAAPVAVPGMVREFAAQQGVGPFARNQIAGGLMSVSDMGRNSDKYSPAGIIDSWKDELKRLLGLDRTAVLGEAMRQVDRFDADLMTNKSLSLTARIRVQAGRNIEREFEYRKKSLMDRIAGWQEDRP